MRPAALISFAIAVFLGPAISSAQNARLGSESRLDRATMQNGVEDRGEFKKEAKVDRAEEAAYKAFLAAQKEGPSTRIQLGEDFASKFPNSRLLPAIYGVLATSYFATGDTDKMFAAGSRALQLALKDLALVAWNSITPDSRTDVQFLRFFR